MKIACIYSPWLLAHRPSGLDFQNLFIDPRGLTGSEYGIARCAEEFAKLGHEVEIFTVTQDKEWRGVKLRTWEERDQIDASYDIAISFNIPDDLRVTKPKFRATIFWLNNFTFCKPGFEEHCDLFIGPSEAHRHEVLNVWKTTEGGGRFDANPAKWTHTPLGCDPEQYGKAEKISGRVIYCSSPDRGLEHLLAVWHEIKAAAPHATLHIFYRLQAWIDEIIRTTDPRFAPMQDRLRMAKAIDAALKKADATDKSIVIRDAVSREEIELEQSRAEVLAYPCDTPIWSEGWSCSVHECCVAKACPIITDCDAFKTVYGEFLPMVERGAPGWVEAWRDLVIRALNDKEFRDGVNEKAHAWAVTKTWASTAENFLRLMQERMDVLGIARAA